MMIEVNFNERYLLLLLGELVFNYSNLNDISVEVKNFLLVVSDGFDDEFDDEVEEEFLEIVVEKLVGLFEL